MKVGSCKMNTEQLRKIRKGDKNSLGNTKQKTLKEKVTLI